MMRLLITALLIAALPLLNGCAMLAVGGAAAATGYVVGEDRRPVATMTSDQSIEFRSKNRILEKYPHVHVNVTSYNHLVLLTGEVPNEATRAEIEQIVRGIDRIRGVYNEIQVAGVSSFPARANDSYITSVVKARFLDARKFNPVHVKVVTEAGTVYLLGLVKPAEADAATELARTTKGVQRVVRLFEFQD
jgi:osmotically-inducible protein OsmY